MQLRLKKYRDKHRCFGRTGLRDDIDKQVCTRNFPSDSIAQRRSVLIPHCSLCLIEEKRRGASKKERE